MNRKDHPLPSEVLEAHVMHPRHRNTLVVMQDSFGGLQGSCLTAGTENNGNTIVSWINRWRNRKVLACDAMRSYYFLQIVLFFDVYFSLSSHFNIK